MNFPFAESIRQKQVDALDAMTTAQLEEIKASIERAIEHNPSATKVAISSEAYYNEQLRAVLDAKHYRVWSSKARYGEEDYYVSWESQ